MLRHLVWIAFVALMGCGQVSSNTYKPLDHYYDRDDGFWLNSDYDIVHISNGTATGTEVEVTTGNISAPDIATTDDFTVGDDLTVTGLATVGETLGVTGDATLSGGAGAATFDDSASSIVVPDNDSTALDIGSTGVLNALRFDTTDNAENVVFNAGLSGAAVSITGATTLDYSNCGKSHFVTAGIDTAAITLPALATVTTGCALTFFYVGADGGALLDISPNASDGVEGTCTLAASVVTFSGTDDADIGLTKATGLQGDSITIVAGNADDWYVSACSGIWANN